MFKSIFQILFLFFILNKNECFGEIQFDSNSSPWVKINEGKIIGTTFQSRDEKDYSAFLGIQYGKVLERFEEPVEIGPLEEDLDATEYGPKCFQDNMFQPGEVVGSEDCLFLNIYVPQNLDKDKLLPVIFFIHGGAFRYGDSSLFKPDYFMDEEVIIVTMNFRQGALGFFNYKGNFGNMGLKDILLALKWVNKNIDAFGGDKNKITLNGVDSGAAAAEYLSLSPLAEKLFNNVILQSGTALSFLSYNPIPDQSAEEFGEFLECDKEIYEDFISCLKETDVTNILKAQAKFLKWFSDPIMTFAPSIEKARDGKTMVLLKKSPYEILSSGEFPKKNIIMGMTEHEGLLFSALSVVKLKRRLSEINENWSQLLPLTLGFDKFISQKDYPKISEKIKQFYLNGEDVSEENRDGVIDMYSDALIFFPQRLSALFHAKFEHEFKVFPYLMDERGPNPYLTMLKISEEYGPSHGECIKYFFKVPEFQFTGFPVGSEKEALSKNLVSTWVSFAENNYPRSWGVEYNIWGPLAGSNANEWNPIRWFHINQQPKMKDEYFSDRMAFWKELMNEFNFFDKKTIKKDEL